MWVGRRASSFRDVHEKMARRPSCWLNIVSVSEKGEIAGGVMSNLRKRGGKESGLALFARFMLRFISESQLGFVISENLCREITWRSM